jgi:hypothetical protein
VSKNVLERRSGVFNDKKKALFLRIELIRKTTNTFTMNLTNNGKMFSKININTGTFLYRVLRKRVNQKG